MMTLTEWLKYPTLLQANAFALIKALIYVIGGYFLANFSSKTLYRWYQKRPQAKSGLLLRKIIFYIIFILFIVSALHALGFNLQVLLGATGVLTIAIGIASQTSVSNFISGLFLLGGQSFRVGDAITINGITGEIIAVDLLALRLRQSDNTLVRVPNEVVIKSSLVNLSYFPYRRFDCVINVLPTISLAQLETFTLPLIADEPLCLKKPAPSWQIRRIDTHFVKMQLSVWALQADFSAMQNKIQALLHQVCLEQKMAFVDAANVVHLVNP